MNRSPHYLLFSESSETAEPGRWRFVLQSADGPTRLVADDIDPVARGDRLELLTVVRGLEALEQPSRVTLLTPNSYVCEGIRWGVRQWRENGWRWEYFGHMVPVKNLDLWQRLDRAMQYHHVDCRNWRIDPAHLAMGRTEGPAPPETQPAAGLGGPARRGVAVAWRAGRRLLSGLQAACRWRRQPRAESLAAASGSQ